MPPPLPGYPSSFSGGGGTHGAPGGIPYPGYKTGGGANAPSLVGGVGGAQLYGGGPPGVGKSGGRGYPPQSGERY